MVKAEEQSITEKKKKQTPVEKTEKINPSEKTAELNLAKAKEDTLEGKYLIFSIDDELYGMEIRYITEIIGIQPIAEVPGLQKEYIKGITNLRGKVIPVMDIRLRFKKSAREYDKRTCIIVIDINNISMGLIVDSVTEVLALGDEEIVPPPEISGGGNKYIKGVGNAEGNVRLMLDCEKLIADKDD